MNALAATAGKQTSHPRQSYLFRLQRVLRFLDDVPEALSLLATGESVEGATQAATPMALGRCDALLEAFPNDLKRVGARGIGSTANPASRMMSTHCANCVTCIKRFLC